MKKSNNKGFSLVELIVVVLIMAIIAVALSPQVMKWVEKSRISADAANYDTIVEAVNISVGTEQFNRGAESTVSLDSAGKWEVTETTGSKLETNLNALLGTTWKDELKPKVTGAGYVITIKADGSVARTNAPQTASVTQ